MVYDLVQVREDLGFEEILQHLKSIIDYELKILDVEATISKIKQKIAEIEIPVTPSKPERPVLNNSFQTYSPELEEIYKQMMNEYKDALREIAYMKEQIRLEESSYIEQLEKLNNLVYLYKESLKTLYSMNVLHPKYQKLEAVIGIFDILSTGRSKSLTFVGYDQGAYSLYEADARVNKAAKIVTNAVFDSANTISEAINSGVNLIAQTVMAVGNQINLAIEDLSYQIQLSYDTLSQTYHFKGGLADILDSINDNQAKTNFLQQAILKEEHLRTLALTEGPFRILKNKSGNIIKI